MKKNLVGITLFLFGLLVCFTAPDANAAGPSKAELDAAKKAGDDESVTRAQAMRDAFGVETDMGNVEQMVPLKGGKTVGAFQDGKITTAYGVQGYDYLTGIGKFASDASHTKAGKVSPLKSLMEKRFTGAAKWKGSAAGSTYSGWSQRTGVTEVWGRDHNKLGKGIADYNAWVNQWNLPSRPDTAGKTLVAGADPDQGAHWFSFYCIHCHGWTGKGDGPTAAMLDPRPRNQTNGKYMNNISNVELFTVIKGGGVARNLSEAMPPWGNHLQHQDIWNTIAFLRSLAKPAYVPPKDQVNAANAKDSPEFQEMNEELELPGVMAGRGVNKGSYNTPGGGRITSMQVGVSSKTSGSGKVFTRGDHLVKHRMSVDQGYVAGKSN